MTIAAPIPEDRPLTTEEATLVQWLLEHGYPDGPTFLSQLAFCRVVSRCPCGCASIDFAIDGAVPPAGAGMNILADYQWQADDGAHLGVFVFAKAGLLAGLEIWSVDGLNAASTLPLVGQLQPLVFPQKAEPAVAPDRGGITVS